MFFEDLAIRRIDLAPFLRENKDKPQIGLYCGNPELLAEAVFVDECGALCAGDKLSGRIDFDINPKSLYNGYLKC